MALVGRNELSPRPRKEAKTPALAGVSIRGAYGIRTRATAVRGRRPRPLDECARREQGSEREVKEERRPTGRRSSATWGHAGGHFPEPQEDFASSVTLNRP
jgi:hypothetical protein